MRFAEADRGGGFSNARLVVALVGASPGPLPRWRELGRAGMDGVLGRGREVFQQLPWAWWDAGSISGASTLPMKEGTLQVGSASCQGPLFWGTMFVAGEGTFWEGAYSFLARKPFGRCFDLHFHFFFMLLEPAQSKQRLTL